MDRRTYLAACGGVPLSGCVSVLTDSNPVTSGNVTCAGKSDASGSNGPGTGSWPTLLHDTRNTGQTDAPGPTGCVEVQWTWSQDPQAGMSAGPVIDDGRVYVPHQVIDNVQFVVLDAETGAKRREFSDSSYQLVPAHAPTLRDERLYLVDGDQVGSVNTRRRKTVWYRDLTDHTRDTPNFGPVRVANGVAYVGTKTGFVFAFDAKTGERRWIHDLDGFAADRIRANTSDSIAEARRDGAVYAPIATTEQRVYVTSWGFSLTALDAMTGERQWQFTLGSDHLDSMHAPVVTDGKVYTQTESAILYVLDAVTGERQWTYDAMGKATDGVSPIVDDESVYVVAGTSTENLFLVALRRTDGFVQWKRQIGPTFVDPVADAETIYLDYGGGLHAIDKTDGTEKWVLEVDGELAAPAAIVDSAVYVADTSGQMYAVW